VKRRYFIFGRLKSWYLIVDTSTLSHIGACHHIFCPSKRSQNALSYLSLIKFDFLRAIWSLFQFSRQVIRSLELTKVNKIESFFITVFTLIEAERCGRILLNCWILQIFYWNYINFTVLKKLTTFQQQQKIWGRIWNEFKQFLALKSAKIVPITWHT
jgi:hypothetical protein